MERYAAILDAADVPHIEIKKEAPQRAKGVRMATMHRLKGLEFKRVILASVQAGQVPLPIPESETPDEASREDHLRRERCLFYVASTRARDELVITGFGDVSEFLREVAVSREV